MFTEIPRMRDNYDFSKMKGKKNPYTKYLKQPITMRLDIESVNYFKQLSQETGIPYRVCRDNRIVARERNVQI